MGLYYLTVHFLEDWQVQKAFLAEKTNKSYCKYPFTKNIYHHIVTLCYIYGPKSLLAGSEWCYVTLRSTVPISEWHYVTLRNTVPISEWYYVALQSTVPKSERLYVALQSTVLKSERCYVVLQTSVPIHKECFFALRSSKMMCLYGFLLKLMHIFVCSDSFT